MDVTCPALLILLADGAGGWLPTDTVGWILPVAMFALGAGLARRRRIPGPESAPATAVERGATLPRYRRSVRDLESELERTRRVGRSLAILVVRLDADSVGELERELTATGGAKVGGAAARCTVHTIFAVVGAILDDCLRDIDLATSDPAGRRYVVLLPEATRTQADETVRRMTNLILDETGVRIRVGISEFRTDGVLLDDLVRIATDACDQGAAAETDSASARQRALSHG